MSNPEHQEIVERGVVSILVWLTNHPGERLDLAKADFHGADLSGALLGSADLRGTDLREANLSGAELSGADMGLADFSRANLIGANMSQANLSESDLSWANLSRANLGGSNLAGARLHGANLSGADLSSASLIGASLSAASLVAANLGRACLVAAMLDEVDLSKADLRGANLCEATLSRANLSGADLRGADFRGAELSRANLTGSALGKSTFTNVLLDQTVLGDLDLSGVRGLDTVKHLGPSTVGANAFFASKGRIPESFLRGCGVPDILNKYLRSLTGRALEFYACFISFDTADNAFSKRLHDELQRAGVRCWRYDEDARCGPPTWDEVEEPMPQYDKLVVVLSERSLNRTEMIQEIARALQKEERDKKQVLFPIRVDDSVFSWEHVLQADVVRRFVGDFSNWHDPLTYRKSLSRLIRDLRTGEGLPASGMESGK